MKAQGLAVVVVLLTLSNLPNRFSEITLDERVDILSFSSKLGPSEWNYIDIQTDLLRRRSQISLGTVSLVNLIDRQINITRDTLTSDFLSFQQSGAFHWTFKSYLAVAIHNIISQNSELFDACYFRHDGRFTYLCLMRIHRTVLCEKRPSELTINTLISELKPPVVWVDKPWKTSAVQSIIHSNCGRQTEACLIAERISNISSRDDKYRFLMSELFSRKSKELLPKALEEIDTALSLDISNAVYHEKRLMLLMRMGRLADALEEVLWLQKHVETVLRQIYCHKCHKDARVVRPSPKTAGEPIANASLLLLSWRPWQLLGLYDLVSSNNSQAEHKFAISLELATSVHVFDCQMHVDDWVISRLQFLKAAAHYLAENPKDAMETAVTNAHTNPAALDSILLVAQLMTEVRLYQRAVNMLNLAIPLVDTVDGSPASAAAIDLITEAGLLKRVALQLRAWLHYRQGDLVEAEADAGACLKLLPTDALCSYVETLCRLVSGRFVQAIYSSASVLSRTDHRVRESPEFIHLTYIREWARFLHAHLTASVYDLHRLADLTEAFKQAWIEASVPLQSLPFYHEQPGVNVQRSWLVASASTIRQTLQSDDAPQRSSSSNADCQAIEYTNSWRTEPVHCQRLHWRRLSAYVCQLETQFRPVLTSGLLPNPQILGRRHRLALNVGVLHVAEVIRNFWCRRRRVSFTTCWAYTQNSSSGGGSPGDSHQRRPETFDSGLVYPANRQLSTPLIGSAGCGKTDQMTEQTPGRGGQPTWSKELALVANLLLLADPSETPPLWWSDSQEAEAVRHEPVFLPRETRTGFESGAAAASGAGDSVMRERNEEEDEEAVVEQQDTEDSDHLTDADDDAEGRPRDFWSHGRVRERQCFIRHSRQVPGYTEITARVIEFLSSAVKLQPLPSSCCDSTGNTEEQLREVLEKFSTSLQLDELASDSPINVSTQQQLIAELNRIWREADRHSLFAATAGQQQQRLVMNLCAPGHADLKPSLSSDFSIRRHLVLVVILTRDSSGEYQLCTLRISNQQHRANLLTELDAAFTEFLSQGEKALATILSGTNTRTASNRLTGPPEDQHLQRAMQSASHWLYYWTALKPLASGHSFHLGFSGLLAMFRALGMEPSVSPDVAATLEMEAMFVGSPEAFVDACLVYLKPTWLSLFSLQLTWHIAPNVLVSTPADFIELLNLQTVENC